jgi:C1A family cysteine protease
MLLKPPPIDERLEPRGLRGSTGAIEVRRDRSQDIQDALQDNSLPLFHWTRDIPDSRDYRYKNTAAKIGDRVDLRSLCTPIEDQGNLGSCTGQAIAGAIEYLNNRSGRPTDISRLFIYYYERAMIGTVNVDSGAYIRDGIKVVFKNGSPLERFWPYNILKFRSRPSNSAITDAVKRRVTLYERISNFYGCINALASGYPVIMGFLVYSSFMSREVARTGIMPYPNVRGESLLGGHAVLLTGYDNDRGHFIARNSWGRNWGDGGYFYMPYGVVTNTAMSGDFWIIKNVNNPK